MKSKKNKIVLWSILTGVSAVLLTVSIIGAYCANTFGSAAINMMFGTSNFMTVKDDSAESKEYYSSDYDFARNGENMYKEDCATIEETEKEGAVLLWNNNDALPLNGGENVSLLSRSSTNLVECGSGSGYVVTYNYKTQSNVTNSMKDAFESRGFRVNQTLWDFYSTGAGSSYKRTNPEGKCTPWQQWWVNEAPWSAYSSSVLDSFNSYGDVAVVTLSRSGGEYSDLHYNYASQGDNVGNNDKGKVENTSADGGYLGLTDEETDLLNHVGQLKENGTFKKVVVLINSGNPLQMQDFESFYGDIDACMWIGQPGSTGINAVVDLLKGEDMNGKKISPSAHLSDTWAYNLNSAPSTINDGNYTYSNTDLLNSKIQSNLSYFDKYMVYQEDIYIGYRYYETRYADCMMNQFGASSTVGAYHSSNNWNYDQEVAFPFGYGLSYADFSYSDYSVAEESDDYLVSVKVKNESDTPAKDVVQIYLSKPYTTYDQEYEIEKSAVELVGYAKTKELSKNESETLTIKVKKEELKSFDSNGRGTYIVEGGDYYLTLATDAHEANNNILQKKGENSNDEKIFGDLVKESKTGSAFTTKLTVEKDYTTYSKSSQTGKKIECQLDNGDINKYEHSGDNKVTYLSRCDWAGTYPVFLRLVK